MTQHLLQISHENFWTSATLALNEDFSLEEPSTTTQDLQKVTLQGKNFNEKKIVNSQQMNS